MQKSIAKHARHLLVDLYDDRTRGLRCCFRREHFDAETHKAVLIWWRHLQECDVERKSPGSKKGRDFREKNGSIICCSAVDRVTVARADEQGVVAEVTCETRRGEFISEKQ